MPEEESEMFEGESCAIVASSSSNSRSRFHGARPRGASSTSGCKPVHKPEEAKAVGLREEHCPPNRNQKVFLWLQKPFLLPWWRPNRVMGPAGALALAASVLLLTLRPHRSPVSLESFSWTKFILPATGTTRFVRRLESATMAASESCRGFLIRFVLRSALSAVVVLLNDKSRRQKPLEGAFVQGQVGAVQGH